MTSQGSLHGQFQRAVERGNVLQALALARDLPPLSLSDSLALLLLFAEHDPDCFDLDRNAPMQRGALRYRLQSVSFDGNRSWVGAATVAR